MWGATRFSSWAITLLVYVNDLNKASDVLDPTMFADGTNLFYSLQYIKSLFGRMNCQLKKICQWFRAKHYL